jgi:tetratricopeptide (TPR) repeat protein
MFALGLLGISLFAATFAVATLLASTRGPRWESPDPDSLKQAKAAYADRDFAQAESILRSMVAKCPSDREAYLYLGRTLVERGRLGEARDVFSSTLKEKPDSYEATRGLAKCLEGQGQWDLALVHYNKAAALRKDDPQAWRELGLAQHRRGDTLGAQAAFKKSLALDPAQADLSRMLTESAVGKEMPGGFPRTPANQDPMIPRPRIPEPGVYDPTPRPPDPMQGIHDHGGRPR